VRKLFFYHFANHFEVKRSIMVNLARFNTDDTQDAKKVEHRTASLQNINVNCQIIMLYNNSGKRS
jgi:hypothetical protein